MIREKKVIIRLKRDEYEQLADLALRQGMNVSGYIRACVFERNKVPAIIEKELKNLNQQIRKIRVTIENTEKKISHEKKAIPESSIMEKESLPKDYTEELESMQKSIIQMQKLLIGFDKYLKDPYGYYED